MKTTDTLNKIYGAIDAAKKYEPRYAELEKAFSESITPEAFSLEQKYVVRYRDSAAALALGRELKKPLLQLLEDSRLAGCKRASLMEGEVHTAQRLVDECLVEFLKSKLPAEVGPVADFSASPTIIAERAARMDVSSGSHIGMPLPQGSGFDLWVKKLEDIATRVEKLDAERARCEAVLVKFSRKKAA